MRKNYFLLIVAALLLPATVRAQYSLPWTQSFDAWYIYEEDPCDDFGFMPLSGYWPSTCYTLYDNCSGSMGLAFVGNMNNLVSFPSFNATTNNLTLTFTTRPEGLGTFDVGYLPTAWSDTSAFVAVATYNASDAEFLTGCGSSKTVTFAGAPGGSVIVFRHRPASMGSIWYVDNIQVSIDNGCSAPDSIAVSNITSSTAELNVYLPSEGVGYIVYLNGMLLDTAYTNTYLLENLTPASNQSVQVYTLCDTNSSPMAVSTSFTTSCPSSPLPFHDDFGSYGYGQFPMCYQRPLGNSNTMTYYDWMSNNNYLGQSLLINDATYGELIVLPDLDVTIDGRDIDFSFKCTKGIPGSSVRVGVMSNSADTMSFSDVAFIVFDSFYSDNEFHEYHSYISYAFQSNTMKLALWFTGADIMLDDINVQMEPSCHLPVAAWLDTTTGESATLRWQNETGVFYQPYEVLYSTIYDWQNMITYGMDPDTTMVTVGTDTSFTVTGLTPVTTYYFWVRTTCSDTSAWHFIGCAATTCPSGYNAPYYVDMSNTLLSPIINYNNIPQCWNVLRYDSFSYRPYIYNSVLEFFNQNNGDTNFIVMPYVRLLGNNMMITLLADTDPTAGNLEVGYVTDPNNMYGFVLLDTIHSEQARYFDIYTTSVPPTEDTIYIAFRFTSRHAAHIYNILVDEMPSCIRPSELVLDTVGHNFATLTAVGASASNYEVLYSTVDNIDSATSVIVGTTTFTLDSLQPLTTYYTWIRSICGTGESQWRTGPSFSTTCGEDACPIDIRIYDVTSALSMAIFTGCGVNVYSDTTFICDIKDPNTEHNYYEETIWVCPNMAPIVLKADAGRYGDYGLGWINPMSIQVTLADSTVYNYDATLYGHHATFLTLNNPCPTCPSVQEVNIGNVTTDHVAITWTPNDTTDDSWIVYLDDVAIDTVTDTAYTFTGLDANTMYSFGVATNCSGTPSTIITRDTVTVCAMYEPCPILVELNDRLGAGAFFTNHVFVLSNNYVVADVKSTAMTGAGAIITEEVYVCSGDSVHIVWGGSGVSAIDTAFSVNIYNGDGTHMAGNNCAYYATNPNIVSFMPYCRCIGPDTIWTIADVNSITVNWNYSDSTEVQISTDEFFTDPYTVFTNEQTVTFDGLPHNTVFYLRLRTYCPIGGRISEWGDLVDTTLYDSTYVPPAIPCPTPEDLTLVSTTYTTATVGWHPTGDEEQWEVNVNVQGDTRLYLTTDTVFVIDSLYPEILNRVCVRAVCGEGYEEALWSDTIEFMTDICPPVPEVSIGIGQITTHSAMVSWQQMENSLGYKLYYGEQGFYISEADSAMLPQEDPSYIMEGLEAETDYELFILNKCTETLYSAPTARVPFSTLAETGIATVSASALVVSPNPASRMVNVSILENGQDYSVEVVDMTGRTVQSFAVAGNQCTIDVTEMAQGAYFIRVTGEKFNAVRKLVVK